jgi:hypothetical protein
MTADPMSPKTLVWLANELEAAMIVNALEDQGIRATAVGGYTSGFRAEAPGGVRVVVARGDLVRAREVLAEARREQAEIAGAEADRDEEEPHDGEGRPSGGPATPPGAASPRKRRPFQYSLGTLVALQTILCVALAIYRGFRVGADVVSLVVLVGTTLALVILGTVWIASDMTRARTTWARVGRVLVPGFAVVVLLELILVVVEIVVR